MAGYSGTPLPQKLGIKPGHSVTLLDAPADFERELQPLPVGAELVARDKWRRRAGSLPHSSGAEFDVIVAFSTEQAKLTATFGELARSLKPAGGLWIAWPKKSSGMTTDISENVIREIGLAAGLVDNKVCAINETWSGLRFVYRVKDRPAT